MRPFLLCPESTNRREVFIVKKCGYFTPSLFLQMIVTDIYNHRFHRIFATNENLSSIMERDDIYV